ncbi:MAG TPA: Ig-like domain-containing protein, partial [Terriglobales bacterium]|nr:Ig-like domain-containing protein [Terriglobales bacterium]
MFFFASLIALFLVDVSSGQRWSSEELSATPASVAFTGVAPASSQSHGIVVLNSGERSLVITAVHVNTTVFGVSTPTLPLTLGPGESANLSVTCSPATSGTFAGSLAIKYGRWSGRTHSLAIPLSASTSGSTTPSPVLQSIAVSPASPSIAVGGTQQFLATGSFSDGSTQNLTTSATWTSSNSQEAGISRGLATGVAGGAVTITASQGGVSSPPVTLNVTAAPATLTSIAVTPSAGSVAVGGTQQFLATGSFSDGSTQNLTTSATWTSSNSQEAGISRGLATGVAAGSVTITASEGGVSSPPVTLSVTAAAPTLTSIAVTPSTASIAVGQTEQFTATGTFSNGSTQNLTTSAAWTSSNSQEAGVSRGLATGATAGSVTITASEGGVSSPAVTLSVTAAPATLTSIAVTPSAASIAVGQTEQFTATGTYSNNTVQNLTSSVTWSASPSDASISSTGLATGTAAGQSNITATMGSVTSSTTAVLTVTEAAAPTGNAFYVSTTGSDSNPGTQSSPWKTIQHAANTVQAGDTVYVRAGVYNESVNIAVSGSATAGPVTFASYPGETAVVDGTGLAVSSSAGTQGLFNLVNQSYVTIQGFEIRNYTTSNANVTPAGIWVTGAGSNVQLLNNLVHNITTTSETNGNAFGIAVYGSSGSASIDSITINGNQVYDNKTGNSETVNVDGNVTNFKISNNLVHDNDNIGIDAIGFEG